MLSHPGVTRAVVRSTMKLAVLRRIAHQAVLFGQSGVCGRRPRQGRAPGFVAFSGDRSRSGAFGLMLFGMLLLSAVLAEPVSAQPLITVADLGTLGGGLVVATGISDGGHIAGMAQTASGSFHAFYWHDGILTDLGTLLPGDDFSSAGRDPFCEFGCSSRGRPVNVHGQVVGTSGISGVSNRAFFIDTSTLPALNMVDITPPGATWSVALGISGLGWVIGESNLGGFLWHWEGGTGGVWTNLGSFVPTALNDLDPPILAGFLGDQPAKWDGGATVLPVPAGFVGYPLVPLDINNIGWIVGALYDTSLGPRPTVWRPSASGLQETILSVPPGFDPVGWAVDVNDAGQVAGNLGTPGSPNHAFLWEDGAVQILCEFTGGCEAVGINDLGWVVVNVSPELAASGACSTPRLWEGGVLTDLGSLAPTASVCAAFASAVNNRGQVTGTSTVSGSTARHVTLWTIVTPASAASTLTEKLVDLGNAGVISRGEQNALQKKVERALERHNEGKHAAACNLLDAFANQVKALQTAGILTADQANSLLDDTSSMKASMGCPP